MVIAIDVSRANVEQRTGTEWYAFHVVQGLKKIIPSEHRVILYTKEKLRDELYPLPDNWEVRVLRWPPKFMWTQIRFSIEMLFNRPDVLYIPAHTIPFIHPKKVALVVHDVGFERTAELYDDKPIGYQNGLSKHLINAAVRVCTLGKYGATEYDYHRFSMDAALRAATKMITVSEFSKREIHDVYDYPLDDIVSIHNGLNTRKVTMNEKAQRAVLGKYGIRVDEEFLLFIGRIEQKKNIPRVIEAYALLRDKYGYEGKLVLAGSPGYQYEKVQELIDKNKLREHIIETGWIKDEDIAVLLHRAKAFIFPSLYEGFGIPVLEAMDAGVPVVCSDIEPLREIAGEAAVFFDPNAPESIAEVTNGLLSDEARQKELVELGKAQKDKFSWEKTAEGTWEVIKNI